MDQPLEDILERRISELEKKVFGLEKQHSTETTLPEDSIIESFSHASTLINSALSGREKIKALIERLPELESYTETDLAPLCSQTDLQLEYILAMEPDIRENIKKLQEIKELLPVIDSDRFQDLPELSEKLQNLTIKYGDLGCEANQVNNEVRDMIARYNDIMDKISKTLILLEAEITKIEASVGKG